MLAHGEKPGGRLWLAGLLPPQDAADAARGLSARLGAATGNRAPLPPVLPLAAFSSPPAPPVPGLLPPCDAPLVLAGLIVAGGWTVWGLASADWPRRLAEALAGERAESPYPLLTGIPLSPSPDPPGSSFPAPPPPPGWRALVLRAWELEIAGNPWHAGVSWRTIWTRRLKRAPARAS